MTTTNLSTALQTLPAGHLALLEGCAALALAQGAAPYLVGGAVRDLLLGRPTVDLDLVVVGDARAVARAAHGRFGGELALHDAFGTATLAMPDGRAIDLITARHERYPAPGSLPVVTPGTLDDDLRRRDFALNAVAVALDPREFGAVVDPLGGQADLDRGIVRTLHSASFRDDPTRLLRAVRYAGRLTAGTGRSFDFDMATAEQFAAAVAAQALATVSTQRTANEFMLLLAEAAAASMVARLAETGLLRQIEPRLHWDDTSAAAFATLDEWWPLAERPGARWQGRFALLAARQAPDAARDTAAALHLPSFVAALTKNAAEAVAVVRQLPPDLSPTPLGHALDRFRAGALVVALALADSGDERDNLRRYLTTVRAIRPTLTGDSIRALGVPPGPIYRDALIALRDQKREQPTLTADEEREFLVAWLRARGVLPTR